MKTIKFLFGAIFIMMLGFAASFASGITPFITVPCLYALSAIPRPVGVLAMAITPEIWQKNVKDHIFKDNEFLNYCNIADEYVLNGTIVHIPQAGAPSGVKRNRKNLPATVTLRQDVDITYALDEFTTDPRIITNAEEIENSYDKVASVTQNDVANLKENIADWMLYKWAPAALARILRTSGGSVAAHMPGATGNRKAFIGNDLKGARKLFNKDGVPREDRYALMSSDQYDQLTTDASYTSTRDALRDMNLPEGVIGRLYGFWIMERATVLTANNDSTPVVKEPDASTGAADNDVIICWQKQSVERAMGDTKAFENKDDATMFGSVYSFLQRMGGRICRNDNKGVCLIIQAHA